MSLFTGANKQVGTIANGMLNGNGVHNGNGTTNGAVNGNGAHENQAAHGANGAAPVTSDFEAATPAMYAEYAGAVQRTLNRMPWNQVHGVVQAIIKTWEQGGQVLLMGNGGSASTATHLACDLSKNTVQPGLPRVRALALNDNMALMTAYANDVGYDAVFAEQLRALAQPGDLVIAISTSGNSPNVLRAVEVARTLGLKTIALAGYAGGKIGALVDIAVVAPNHCVEQIEDIHMVLAHVVTVGVRSAMLAALVRGAEFEQGTMLPSAAPVPYMDGDRSPAPYAVPTNGNNGNSGNAGNGVRPFANRPANYVHPPSMPDYWHNGASLNGHD